ncbi:TCR/Tet family MFS transporter [Agrobacterium salinitolerans]|uniref:TCR/Tet family MFS transporter n=1 Tax=Agrobacterium salinitolerans TaxID=1183413 RepID=UPI0020B41DBF|nr:TCR/Tet family MFS transporter [Agrobacterium salinitolerans]
MVLVSKSIAILWFTVALSGTGIGLVLPVVPLLFEQFGHQNSPVLHGLFLAVFAFMQVVCAPVLGTLSDRYGRRRVLLISLAGGTLDYLLMAFAPTLPVLFLARAISGMTSAVMAVANAYVADVTPTDQRTRRFGYLASAFGLGFVVGPAAGGMLGDYSLQSPFIFAAILNALNLILVAGWLSESHPAEAPDENPGSALGPLAAFRWALRQRSMIPLLAVYVIMALVGEIGATVWVLHGQDRYGWNSVQIGLSLAGLGLFHAAVQAFATGPIGERLGEFRTVLFAVLCDTAACALLAFASMSWMAVLLIPLFCLGGVGEPALLSAMSRQVAEEQQGLLQGVLSSAIALAAIAGPPVFGTVYMLVRDLHTGAVWLIGAAVYLACIPILNRALAVKTTTTT